MKTYPLSPFQLPFWIEYERDRASPSGNRACAFHIDAAVDLEAFRRAWADVLARHDVVRASYRRGANGVEHVILDEVNDALVVEPIGATDEAISQQVQRAVLRPFDLERGPVIRGLLLIGEGRAAFSFISHHIQADVSIVDTVLAELGVQYDHHVGKGPPLPPLSSESYATFVAEQAKRLADPAYWKRMESFWRGRLENVSPELPFPRDRPGSEERSGTMFPFVLLDVAQGKVLRDVCERLGCTRFRFLLACYFAFVRRYGAEGDIAVGMSVTRADKKYNGTIGNYANVVPLVARVDLDESVASLATRIAGEVRAATDNAEYPFTAAAGLVAARGAGVDVFRTMFSFGKFHRSASLNPIYLARQPIPWRGSFGSLPVTRSVPIDQHGLTVDIELLLGEVSGAIAAQFGYDTQLFDASTVATFAEHLRVLVRAALDNPTLRIGDLPLMSPEERESVLERSAGPAAAVSPRTVLEAFLAHAKNRPEHVACVEPDGREVRYGELAERARRIANGLEAAGIAKGDRVGVLLPRSSDVLATFLGAWLAGAAYVPIDPEYPAERIQRIVGLSRMARVVVREHPLAAGDVPTSTLAELASASPLPRDHVPDGDDVAYVIFTSGSTGAPKGVVVNHLGIASYAADLGRRWPIGDGARLFAFASFAFDSSVSDWCGGFAAGATVVIRPPSVMGGNALWTILRERRVTHAHLPPAVWSTLPDRPLPDLAFAMTSGDACPVEVVRTWSKGRRMLNEYGPTEITVCATSAVCTPDRAPDIGTPITNVRAYVVDDRLSPVPDGVKGELALGGIGLARGYFGDEAQTHERFVAVDFPLDRRVYRTGDVVRRGRTGHLSFLGRSDNQVKIRGHRVEPGEIESVVETVTGVSQGVVTARTDLGPHAQLVLHYVGSALVDDVRKELRRLLPPYLVPSHVVRLDALPLSPHGKVARDALPHPLADDHAAKPDAVPAPAPAPTASADSGASPLAKALAEWRAVLQRSDLGADDNFFEHGGDSLMAVELADRLSAAFGRDVGVIDVFECASARSWVDRFGSAAQASGPRWLRPGPGAPIVLVPPPGGELAVYASLVEAPGADVPLLGLALEGAADLDGLLAQLEAQVPPGEVVLAGWSVGGVLAHALAARLEAAGRPVRALVLFDAYAVADVTRVLGKERADALVDAHRGSEATKALVPVHLALAAEVKSTPLRAPVHHFRASGSQEMPEAWHTPTTHWITATHDDVVRAAARAASDLFASLRS